ncbi:unnamed protein product [Cochlearia groenlandica]
MLSSFCNGGFDKTKSKHSLCLSNHCFHLLQVDTSKWKKLYSIEAGIENSVIPESPLNVLRVLKQQGFDAYLVGGCVRDLILHRAPKDYDVITTANLKQIRRMFHRAQVIGKRFPICHVWMRGSIIEVSSFDTVAQSDSEHESDMRKPKEGNKNIGLFKKYSGWDLKDCKRWRNSVQRDFTVNSLFFDPFEFKVYDYTNGIQDLMDLKLRTLVPAHLSFSEDCARILRGLRIAARLGLSLSDDIETAIPVFISSVANLGQFRLILEMNYMLAYGAAAPSILLLMKFKLLHVLLPFQAAYMDQGSKTALPSSLMLVRLFSNMDKLVSCDQPADSRLWIAVLAFHTALVRNPQEAIVLRAFASLLYHRDWRKAVKFAREHENLVHVYSLEVSKSSGKRSDEDLATAVSEFIHRIIDTRYVLTEMKALREALHQYPNFKCSGVVFIPKTKGKDVAEWFKRLSDVESYESRKEGFSVDYNLLGKGSPSEIGFVLGKIILDTIIEPLELAKVVMEDEQAPVYSSKASSVSRAKRIISKKKIREDSEHDNDDETLVQKPKRRRKEALVPESVNQKTLKPETRAPVSDLAKQKTSKNRSKETRQVKDNIIPVKEIREDARNGFVSDKSLSDLFNVAVKPIQQAPMSNEETRRPRKLSSLFR